jgi:hypothetical protein
VREYLGNSDAQLVEKSLPVDFLRFKLEKVVRYAAKRIEKTHDG